MPSAVPGPASPTQELTPLNRNRDFLLLQAGQLLSTAGSSMSAVAIPLLALAVTHSPVQAGIIQAGRAAPLVLFSLFAGVAADRYDRRRLMIASDAVSLAAFASLAAAVFTGHVTFWHMFFVALLDGTTSVVFAAAKSGAFRAVVPRQQLPAATSLEQARASTVRLVGPPAGGALYGIGRVIPFAADAVSYAFSTLSLLLMRTPFQQERGAQSRNLRLELREGLGFLWKTPFLRMTAIMTAATNFTFAAGQFAVIVLARRHGLSSAAVGGLVALVGVTTLAGSFSAPIVQRLVSLRAILLAEVWASFGLLLFLVFPSVYVLAGALAAQAFCFPNTDAAVASYRFAVTPDHLTARVSSAATNVAAIAAPSGPLIAGLLLDSTPARTTVFALAAVSMLAALFVTADRTIRGLPPLSEVLGSASP
jgi:MFS family permease